MVDSVTSKLHDIPGVGVANHGELYEAMHDGLMAALDADPAAAPAGLPQAAASGDDSGLEGPGRVGS